MKMHINHLKALIILILSLYVTSCNSDIFIDKNMEMPDNLVINLEGDMKALNISLVDYCIST